MMIDILIWLAIAVLAIFVITFLAKVAIIVLAVIATFIDEYKKQNKYRGGK